MYAFAGTKFSSVTALVLAATATFSIAAKSYNLSRRDVFDPTILSPNASTVWTAGCTYNVIWNTTNAPAVISNLALITLEDFGRENMYGPEILASGFSLLSGSQNITLPKKLNTSETYEITLFGDSGNISPPFTITAASSSGTTCPDTD